MKVFLSYGHDRNAPLVDRIGRDLEAAGHEVWIDKSEIKTGEHWRRSIVDGLRGTDWVLAFLSRHSVRDPLSTQSERPESTYCGRSKPRSWTPQLGGKRAYTRRLGKGGSPGESSRSFASVKWPSPPEAGIHRSPSKPSRWAGSGQRLNGGQ